MADSLDEFLTRYMRDVYASNRVKIEWWKSIEEIEIRVGGGGGDSRGLEDSEWRMIDWINFQKECCSNVENIWKKEEKRNLGGKLVENFKQRGRIYDITRFLSIRDNEIINDD